MEPAIPGTFTNMTANGFNFCGSWLDDMLAVENLDLHVCMPKLNPNLESKHLP